MWVRLDDHFPEHPKLVALSTLHPLAGWLYVCALAWCNRYLTDGVLPKAHVDAGRLVSFFGLLYDANGVEIDPGDVAGALVDVGLWEDDGTNYRIHDYLEYQPSREKVEQERERMRSLGRKSAEGRSKRTRRQRTVQRVVERTVERPVDGTTGVGAQRAVQRAVNGATAVPIPIPIREREERSRSIDEDLAPSEAVSERAGEFVRWYETRYAEVRQSAYFRRPSLDFDHACRLVQTYPDDAWLRDMAEVYLLTDHQDAARSSRTIGQFTTLAGWCDARLRESGRRPAQAVAS